MFNSIFFWFTVSLLITIFSLPLIIKLAFKTGLVDYPDGKLKIHKNATPYLGGLSLLLLLLLCCAFYAPLLIPGLSFLFLLGLVDDAKRLRPKSLFLGHSIGALLLLIFSQAAYLTHYSLLNYFLSYFWLVSIINAFNLVDVMDGVAATISLWAALGFAYIFFVAGSSLAYPAASLIGTLLVFLLFYNRPPARIYLGDAGSLLLGGFFGVFSIQLINLGKSAALPILLLAVPIFEILSLILIRTYKGIPFYQGSRDHFSHNLVKFGLSNISILLIISLIYGVLLSLILVFN